MLKLFVAFLQSPCSGIVTGFRAKDLELKTLSKHYWYSYAGASRIQNATMLQYKVWFESECVCTNQQLPQPGGVVPDPAWIGSKWLLAFPRVPGTLGTPLHFFAMLPPERPQKGSSQLLQNQSLVFSFSFLLPFFVSSFFSFS